MAGIFGDEINGRADFLRELDRARALAAKVLQRLGPDGTLEVVQQQLEFIAKCVKGGRTPTAKERKSIDMGLRMTREYEVIRGDPELYDFKDIVLGLDLYFEHWPSDELAADEDNDEKLE